MTAEASYEHALDAVKVEERLLADDFKNKVTVKKSDIYSLFFAFLNRARFNYTLWDIFIYTLRCLCFRDIGDYRKEKAYKKHFLYEKAEEKF